VAHFGERAVVERLAGFLDKAAAMVCRSAALRLAAHDLDQCRSPQTA